MRALRTVRNPRRSGVSLVITVLNEGPNLPLLLAALEVQTHKPDQIIIVDGGSQDETSDVLRSARSRIPGLVVLEAPGATIGSGRNKGIRNASHDVILVTDAGCRPVPEWAGALAQPLLSDRADVVGGVFLADARTPLERSVSYFTHPQGKRVWHSRRFLPSSRSVAFSRSAWAAVGGYSESLRTGEDTDLMFRMRECGLRFDLAPSAVVFWRPRGTFGDFFRLFYHYARGNRQAGRKFQSYAAVFLFYALLLLSSFLLGWIGIVPIVGYLAAHAIVGRRMTDGPVWHYPVLLILRDLAKMMGYASTTRMSP